jgi:hypothetical protein
MGVGCLENEREWNLTKKKKVISKPDRSLKKQAWEDVLYGCGQTYEFEYIDRLIESTPKPA